NTWIFFNRDLLPMDIDTQYLLLEELPTGVSVKNKHQIQKSGKTYNCGKLIWRVERITLTGSAGKVFKGAAVGSHSKVGRWLKKLTHAPHPSAHQQTPRPAPLSPQNPLASRRLESPTAAEPISQREYENPAPPGGGLRPPPPTRRHPPRVLPGTAPAAAARSPPHDPRPPRPLSGPDPRPPLPTHPGGGGGSSSPAPSATASRPRARREL
uniref:Uncharacterized protein n=1 Tax=Aquila chrysaetos chrysaetos TaxID=223781 RepID=A0A663EDQ8_AQUCH